MDRFDFKEVEGNALGSVAIWAVPMAWPAKRIAATAARMVLKYMLMEMVIEELKG